MKATIKILNKEYVAEGETVKEALENLGYKGFAKLNSVLTIKEKTVYLAPMRTQRLFALSPLMRQIAIKQIAMLFE